MRVVFFGSDDFSIKALEACLHSGMEITQVVTTPAQKKGRGLHLEPSEVFTYATAKQLPVVAYPTLRDPQVAEALLALRPDIFVVASYGKLIPPDLLTIPTYRLNVHPSLLPRYRGAAPVNWPILNGDTVTGVSIIDIVDKMDAGDIYYQEEIVIEPRMTAQRLYSELTSLSYGVLKKVLEQVKGGKLRGVPQNEADVTLARQLLKTDGELSFDKTAVELDRKVRGLQPWPGCFFFLKGERIGLLETFLPGYEVKQKPGTVLSIEKDGGLMVATGEGVLKLLQVKPAGKKAMPAAFFAHGRHLRENDLLAP